MNRIGLVRSLAGGLAREQDERGQVLVVFALALIVLLGSAGLVIDLGGSWAQVRTEQKVADVAALAGATAEANGASRAAIIQAATDSAVANGYQLSEIQVNIPPIDGAYAPGGSASGALSTNDCSTPAQYPCWVEVKITRPHSNSFSRVLGFNAFDSAARGVAVGGIANAVANGISPLMFNYKALQEHGSTPFAYCDPHPSKCSPNSSWPLLGGQFAWTTFCLSPVNCNVNSNEATDIIEGGNFQVTVTLGMYLGPHNNGQKTAVCHALLDQYPDGADIPVAINDDNGNLVGFWIWHLDTANSDCEGPDGEVLSGNFVEDITSSLPLTINAGAPGATFGQPVVRLVE